MAGKHGIILFGHGARDPRWAEPFQRLLSRVRDARGGEQPVSLAFLELMTPGLVDAVAAQVAQGCSSITVVPVFFGQGGHVRKDLPRILDECRGLHPHVAFSCATAVGEDDAVLDALALYCLRQVG
jgi:sirohydrochlorin cobaltochelatase